MLPRSRDILERLRMALDLYPSAHMQTLRALIGLLGLITASAFIASSASASRSDVLLPDALQFSRVYIPLGFDDNDNVELVAEGTFTGPCDEAGAAHASVDSTSKTIALLGDVQRKSSDCGQDSRGFQKTLEIGHLDEGSYDIKQSGHSLGVLRVIHTENQAQDSSSFIPISSISLQELRTGASSLHWVLRMKGEFPSNCVDYGSTKIEVQSDVIVILPLGRLWEFGCVDRPVPFEISYALPDGISPGRYLLHVRSAGGKSFNQIFNLAI